MKTAKKTKEKWSGRQKKKENNDRKNDKRFWNWFLKQDKRKLMATNYYSTNHANLSVIVASHGSLAITNPWLQETIQSMANKKFLLHSNNTFIPHNKLQVTIKSSKSVRDEHEIKKTLQVSKLVG